MFGNFPLMFAIIAVPTFLLLARAFRSVVLAAKALLLNLVSLSATFGLMTWFWQEGHGSNAVFGIPATGAITFWVPLMVFAFLFGLSMDYEVFILARIREGYDRTGSTSHAVVEGLSRTGRLVTSAALILFLAFAVAGHRAEHRPQGAGDRPRRRHPARRDGRPLPAGPALVELFGRWNWWLPAPARPAAPGDRAAQAGPGAAARRGAGRAPALAGAR